MKRLYTYYPKFDDEENLLWYVHESATEQVIAEFFFEEDAKEYCQFLEYGGGFNGFTPSFVLKRPQLGDINSAFEMEFQNA